VVYRAGGESPWRKPINDMGYSYESKRAELFTDEGQRLFLRVRDRAHRLIEKAGAFRMEEVLRGLGGDTWLCMACVDRLVELGEIVELRRDCWAQYRVFTTPKVHNL
jgi:hypothetical protein